MPSQTILDGEIFKDIERYGYLINLTFGNLVKSDASLVEIKESL